MARALPQAAPVQDTAGSCSGMGLLFFGLFFKARPERCRIAISPAACFIPCLLGAFLLSPGAKYAILYNDNFDSEVTER